MDDRTAHGVDHARFTLGIAAVAVALVPAGTPRHSGASRSSHAATWRRPAEPATAQVTASMMRMSRTAPSPSTSSAAWYAGLS